jgi:hypothetical protein
VGRVVESGRWFGPHGDLVGALLDEVASQRIDWSEFEQGPRAERWLATAGALTEIRWPAALIDAVFSGSTRAYSSLGLRRADFSSPLGRSRVRAAIEGASQAIAAGEKLASEHRRVLLAPFVDAGFVSAVEALRVLDGVEPRGAGW